MSFVLIQPSSAIYLAGLCSAIALMIENALDGCPPTLRLAGK